MMKFLVITLTMLISFVYGEWQTEIVDENNCTGWTSLTLDITKDPHISYTVGFDPQSLKYAYWDSSMWHIETVIGNRELYACQVETVSGLKQVACICPSLALDSSGVPDISYTRAGFLQADICYTYGPDWPYTLIVNNSGCYSSLQLDSSSYPCICFSSYYGLEYVKWDGANWQYEMVDSSYAIWYFTSLELDYFEYPHISYYEYRDADLLYASWDGSAWQTEVVDSEDHVGLWSSLDLDVAGHPHIAYSDSTNRDLKYAHWDGSNWQIETVDSIGAVGQWVSLDLYSSGYPCISYYDDTNKDLKYAYWDGSDWQIETVDSDGSVGQYTSLELDPAGHAHISYVDATNYNLKYAYQYVTSIEGSGDVEGCYFLPLSPNPASGTFSVKFSIPENATVELSIYDMSGRLVKQSIPTAYASGLHQISFSGLETGVYLCRMISGDFTATQSFVVIE